MKIYLNSEDLGKTITYKEEKGKKNYLYCKEGFEICENAQYIEQLLKKNAQLKKKVLDYQDGIMIVFDIPNIQDTAKKEVEDE